MLTMSLPLNVICVLNVPDDVGAGSPRVPDDVEAGSPGVVGEGPDGNAAGSAGWW